MTKLTPNQADAMKSLNNYVGQTVQIITSFYDANVNPNFKPVCHINSATLRGLEAKGFIRIDNTFWKGALITVLKSV